MNVPFDYIWAIFYLCLMFLAYYSRSINRRKRAAKLAMFLVFVFVAFRAPVVGGDTWNYVRYLTGERYYYNDDVRDLEISFIFYRNIISSITTSRLLVMIINTIISMGPVFYLYKKYSLNVPLSFLLFFLMGAQHLYFIGLRQIIGNSFILWALIFFLSVQNEDSDNINHKKKLILSYVYFAFSIVVAYSFHTTCIVYGLIIILLFFVPLKNKMTGYILIVSSLIVGLILQYTGAANILNTLYYMQIGALDRVSLYFEWATEKDVYMWNVISRLSVVGIITLYFMREERINHIFTKLFIFGIVLYNLLFSLQIIDRFTHSFSLFGFICFSWIFESRRKEMLSRARIITVLLVLYLTRSVFIELNNWVPTSGAKMHPYYFFFQDYSDHPSIKYGT